MFLVGWLNINGILILTIILSVITVMSTNVKANSSNYDDYTFSFGYDTAYNRSDTLKRSLIQKNDFGFSGSASIFSSIYNTNMSHVTVSPFNYGLALSTTFKYKKFTLPFSLRYSQNKFNVTYPFFRFSLSPTYKWAKFYFGNQTLTYNRFVFSGVNILGAGFEIHPGWLYLSVIGGVVNQKIFVDSTSVNYNNTRPRFSTNVFAIKTGIKTGVFNLLFSYLDGRDVKKSLKYFNPKYKLTPRSNKSFGAELMIRLFRNITLSSIGGVSIFTRDMDAQSLDTLLKASNNHPLPSWAKLIEKNPNTTSQIFYGTENIVQYQNKTIGIGVKQKIVMPEYQSLGLRLDGNDVEQYTFESNVNLMNGKVTYTMSVGLQKNNLLSKLSLQTKNTIYDFSLNIAPNDKLFINANISNYGVRSSSTSLTPEDSISIRTINNNIGVFGMYSLSRDRNSSKVINVNINIQNSTERYGGNRFINSTFNSLYFNGSYSANNAIGLSYNGSFNYAVNSSILPEISNEIQNIQSYGISGGCGLKLKRGDSGKNELSVGSNLILNYTGLLTGEKKPGAGLGINLQYNLTKRINLSTDFNVSRTTIQNVKFNQQNININLHTIF